MKASEMVANRAVFGPDSLLRVTEDSFANLIEYLPEDVVDKNYLLLVAIHQKLFPHKREGSIRQANKWLALPQSDDGARGICEIDGNFVSIAPSRTHLCPVEEGINIPEKYRGQMEAMENSIKDVLALCKDRQSIRDEFRVEIINGREIITHPDIKGFGYDVKYYTDALAGFRYVPDTWVVYQGTMPLLCLTSRDWRVAIIAPLMLSEKKEEG
jgi:hypothetical protein